ASGPIANDGPGFVREAGMRVFLDVTPLIRDPIGREAIERATALGEARSSVALQRLAADPRLARRARSRRASALKLGRLLLRSRIPFAVVGALRAPDSARRR